MKILKDIVTSEGGFDICATSVGLMTKTPINNDALMKGLTQVAQYFPDLSDSEYLKSENAFKLKNDSADVNRQKLLRIDEGQRIEFAWGQDLEMSQKELMELFDRLELAFSLYPINLSYIDYQVFLTSSWEGNHYSAISNAFISNSPLSNLFESDSLLQLSFNNRGMIDRKRIAVYQIQSNIQDEEILKQKFRNDTLKASCGIAHVKSIGMNEKLGNLFSDHYEAARSYIERTAIPNYFIPLNNSLIEHMK